MMEFAGIKAAGHDQRAVRWPLAGRGQYRPNSDQRRTVRQIDNSTLSRRTSRLLLPAGQLNKRREQFRRGYFLLAGFAVEFPRDNRLAGCAHLRESVRWHVPVTGVVECVFAPP